MFIRRLDIIFNITSLIEKVRYPFFLFDTAVS